MASNIVCQVKCRIYLLYPLHLTTIASALPTSSTAYRNQCFYIISQLRIFPSNEVVPPSACSNGRKRLPICSFETPMPLSITSICKVMVSCSALVCYLRHQTYPKHHQSASMLYISGWHTRFLPNSLAM